MGHSGVRSCFAPNLFEPWLITKAAAGYDMYGKIYSFQGALRNYYNGEF